MRTSKKVCKRRYCAHIYCLFGERLSISYQNEDCLEYGNHETGKICLEEVEIEVRPKARDSFFQRGVGKTGWRPEIQTDCGAERKEG